jgi:hypothetical protein
VLEHRVEELARRRAARQLVGRRRALAAILAGHRRDVELRRVAARSREYDVTTKPVRAPRGVGLAHRRRRRRQRHRGRVELAARRPRRRATRRPSAPSSGTRSRCSAAAAPAAGARAVRPVACRSVSASCIAPYTAEPAAARLGLLLFCGNTGRYTRARARVSATYASR